MKPRATLPAELLTLLPPSLQAAVEPVALFYVVRGDVVLERAGLQGQMVVLQRVRRDGLLVLR